MYYNSIELYSNILPLRWSTQKIHPNALEKDSNALLLLKIHLSMTKNTWSYLSIYICIPFKYITVFSKNRTYFWHILQYQYYTPISFHISPFILHLFVLSLTVVSETVLRSLFYHDVLHLPWHLSLND
jgi:hypothetical protein